MDWQSGISVLGIGLGLVTWVLSMIWPTLPRRVLLFLLMVGICLMLVWPMAFMIGWLNPGPMDDKIANHLSNAKPHVMMKSYLEMVESQATAMVAFNNLGPDNIDKLTLKIMLNDGHEVPEKIRELSILRANTHQKFYVDIPQKMFDDVVAGEMALNVVASVSYSLHGIPYTESCMTKWKASMRRFDYVDC